MSDDVLVIHAQYLDFDFLFACSKLMREIPLSVQCITWIEERFKQDYDGIAVSQNEVCRD